MRAFITGATGFIGGHVARQWLARGHGATCLVRDPGSPAAQQLQPLGAELVAGDITRPEMMREAMTGSDVLFHIAGRYKIGLEDSSAALRINVDGTRSVLGLAHELKIPNIVYTSTALVLGNTRGRVVDESHRRDSPFDSEYTRTKTMAHEIALEYIAQGSPIRIVMPGAGYGPGDHSLLGVLLRDYLRGRFPAVPGADSGVSLIHVADVAEGHILAVERGKPGESYLLAGTNLTYCAVLEMVAQIAGRRPPLALPSWPVPVFIQVARLANRFLALPPIFHPETLQNLNRVTYWFSSAKAGTELGWQPRPLEDGVAETVHWELEQLAEHT